MTLAHLLIATGLLLLVLAAVMTFAWVLWRRTGNAGWVDTCWTFGLGFTGVASAAGAIVASEGSFARQLLIACLIAVWTLRLGGHIALRTSGIKDDPRYAKLAESWGSDAPRRMFWMLQMQAYASLPLALSMFLAAWNPLPELRLQDWLAGLIFIVALGGEALSDAQLRAFARDPANKGKVCDTGLWGWSRHPNYFFEWLGWCAYPLFAIDGFAIYPWGWLALLGPAFMYWLLVYISGIPPLEQHMLETRGRAFRDYQNRVSAFFPLPPKTDPGAGKKPAP
ncbi:hypothetical protein A7A08_02470 [Methyloligella halotolerans]|uniref:Uncharacterized protein n=1 Tax=Methyloligella halotolerans TaxID=1177755 RepID=A0A1E2RX19_9HYPH|nr:DUF1295 domain-containing protein [Methyloligella halotolerans]ODA66702.1 hypothetical protein A7A08_02470 [Methyloligella halotolerans]